MNSKDLIENIKKELTYEILRSINNKGLLDVEKLNNKNNQAFKVINQIKDTKIKKALEESLNGEMFNE